MNDENLKLTVAFHETLKEEEAAARVSDLPFPHIVLWYIGTSGLKESCVRFYQNKIIDPILIRNPNVTFWLVDLTAWSALKDKNSSVFSHSSVALKIDGFYCDKIKCVKSSLFFSKVKSVDDDDFISYFQSSLSRSVVWFNSECFQGNEILLRDLFNDDCKLMSIFYDREASKSYSMLQYLEGCFLIEEIVKENVFSLKKTDVVVAFLLPNDEGKYYKCDAECFVKDVRFTLLNALKEWNGSLKVSVEFFSFGYGDSNTCRPYNARGKNIRKNDLILQDITSVIL